MSAREQRFWSGLFFMALGLTTLVLSMRYSMWIGTRVGSGLFPPILGCLLAAIGAIVFAQGFLAPHGRGAPWKLRPILCLCLALVAYGLLVVRFGNLIALAAATVIAGFADKPNFKYLAIVYVVAVAFLYVFLIRIVNLPYRLY